MDIASASASELPSESDIDTIFKTRKIGPSNWRIVKLSWGEYGCEGADC